MAVNLEKLERLYNNAPSATYQPESTKAAGNIDMDKLTRLYNNAPSPAITTKGQINSVPVVASRGATPTTADAVQQQNYDKMQGLFAKAEQQKDLTAADKIKMSAGAIGRNVVASPIAAASAFWQTTTDPVELEIQALERKADQGILDEAGWQRLAELKPQQYTKELDTSGWSWQQLQKAQQLQEDVSAGFGNTGKFLYNTGMSMATNLATLPANLIAPGASLALMGTQSMAGKALDVAENGGSAGEAFYRGLASGGIETATEAVSLDTLSKAFKGKIGKTLVGKAITNLATEGKIPPVLMAAIEQSFSEGGEELVSAIANWAADVAADDPNAQLTAEDLVLSFLGGALSGGVMGAGGYGVGRVVDNIKNKQADKTNSTENVAKPTENVAKPTENVINSTENVINSTENAVLQPNAKDEEKETLIKKVQEMAGVDTRTETEKVTEEQQSKIAAMEDLVSRKIAPQEHLDRVRQSAEETIAETKAKESLDSAVKLIEHVGKEADVYSDSRDRAAAYNTAKRIGINLAHSDTTAMGRAVHEVGHDKTQSEQWQNYTAALDRLIATDGRLVKLMDDIDYAYRNSEDAEIRASVSFADGTINNAKIREEQYLKLTEIMLPNIAKGDKQLLDAIKKDRNVLDNLLDFIRGIKNKVSIKLTKSEAAMLDEAERQLVNLLRSEGAQADGKQYSYGGTRAANPPEGFLRADRLAEFDTDNEDIRQETGWFKGADGKWRFEIDDSKAVVSYKGDLEQNKNPEYREYQDLFNALYIEMEDRSDEDFERFKVLDKKFSNSKKDLRLKDYMQHDELYRYYPQIAEIPVAKIKGSSNGKYDGLGIQINESLLRPGYEKQFKETLLHEVQHVIQETEGFARGASTKYWTGKEGNTGKTARELYLNTAGEQESRDVEKRMNYTAEQRRAEAPFTGDENTVFVDGSTISYSEVGDFVEQVEKARNGELSQNTHLKVLSKTPKFYSRFGFDTSLPILMTKKHAIDTTTPEDGVHKEYHGITDKQLKETVKELKEPVMVFESLTQPGRLVAVVNVVDDKKRPIIVALQPNAKGFLEGSFENNNLIASLYGKDGFKRFFTNNVTEDNLLYVDKVKSRHMAVIPGVQFPNNIPSVNFDNNIQRYIKKINGNNLSKNDNTDYSLQSDIDTNEYWGENSKSRAVERHAVNEFTNYVAELFGVEYKDKTEILKKQAWKLADAAKKTGMFNSQQMIDFFNDAYNMGKQGIGNLDERNKQLKKELRNLGIKPLKGREYLDFVQKYKGKIIFNNKGMDIDVAYKQLAENYPEWFSEDITNPYDMMRAIGDVYDSIQGKKVSNTEYFGKDAEAFKNAAFQQYSALVDNFIDTMNSVSRYQLALGDQKAQKEAASKKVYTIEDVKAARELAQPLMKEIARMDRKNLFTAEDRNRLDEMLKLSHPADVERMQESLRATNPLAEDIIAMYEKKKMLEAVQKPIFEYNKQRKARLKEQFLGILQTSDSWKDKGSGLAYMNNTFERNIDDIVTDKKAAEELKNILPRQIHKHVADATRYKNKLRDKIRGFNIDTKKVYNIEVTAAGELLKGEATEADLIQMYGEGIVTKQYLDKIGADTKKIAETADKFREIYNELFEKINEAYVANGYAPMEYRQDYFPHFFDETGDTLLNKVGQFLGFDAKNMLPTEIAGRTHEFSPGRQWNSHALQRKGEKTDYNVLKGFDNYIEAAANIIHLIEDIQNLRAFESAIRYKYSDEGMKAELDAIDGLPIAENEKQEQREKILKTEDRSTKLNNFVVWEHEYTNILAGKKSKADRWIEDMFGRRFYTVAKNIENRVSANMIAGNISSAITNFIPITQLTAEVDLKYIATAMYDTMKNLQNNDGFVDMSDFLTNRFGSEMLSLTNMQKAANIAGKPMELVDEFTSNVVTRARYLQNLNKNGMDSGSAMKEADEYAAKLMADRSKGALPVIFESKNPLIKLFTMFQVEQNNQLQYFVKDLPKKMQGDAKKWIIWGLIKASIFAALFNALFRELAGREPALSPIDLAIGAGKDIAAVKKGEMKASAAMSNAFVDVMENLPYVGSVLAVTGLSEDAGRIPVSGALPDFSQLFKIFDREVSAEKKKAVAKKELAKPAFYLAAPFAGGTAKRVVETKELYGKNKGVQYSIQSDGSKKVQFANDPSVGAVAQSAVFGKWASKPAQEYINSGFKGLSKNQTKAFEGLKDTGLKNSEAVAMVKGISEADTDNNGYYKTEEAKSWLDRQDLTRKQKAILFRCMCPNVKNNPYE